MSPRCCFLLAVALCLLAVAPGWSQQADLSRVPGTVIAYSPASSGQYIGSPSICVLPNGDYLASHDLFGPESTEHGLAVSRIYLSKDKGKTWSLISEIKGQFWSKLFVHRGGLYFFGTSKHNGNAIIRKSPDNGKTWTTPADAHRGLLLQGAYHCAPTPIVEHKGRLWRTMEDASRPVGPQGKPLGAFMMSAPADGDLLQAANWTSSEVLHYNSDYRDADFGGWLEGNAVVDTSGAIVNILRTAYKGKDGEEKAAIIHISEDGKRASFGPAIDLVSFPGGAKKFTVSFDAKSGFYWTIANYVPPAFRGKNPERTRNTAALLRSRNLHEWELRAIILQHPDVEKSGFQYVDWVFDGKDILVVSRTAFDDGIGGAASQHDSNLMTFHRVREFRKLGGQE